MFSKVTHCLQRCPNCDVLQQKIVRNPSLPIGPRESVGAYQLSSTAVRWLSIYMGDGCNLFVLLEKPNRALGVHLKINSIHGILQDGLLFKRQLSPPYTV